MPYPAPETTKLLRCAGVAWSNRGYHASGVLNVRPSARSTVSVSSSIRTALIFSPALGSKVRIPCLHEALPMLHDDPFDHTQFVCRETNIVVNGYRREPELGRRLAGVDMNMPRLTEVSAVEVEPVRTLAEERRHCAEFTLTVASPRSLDEHFVSFRETRGIPFMDGATRRLTPNVAGGRSGLTVAPDRPPVSRGADEGLA